MKLNKKAQEEMVGFAIIVILIAVIILVVLMLSLKKPDTSEIDSYKVESFIQSFLQYTTDCRDNLGFLSVRELILSCMDSEKCLDSRDACDVLNKTLSKMIKEAWLIDEKSAYKGYILNISSEEKGKILLLKQGNMTNNYKSALQDFSKAGKEIEIKFNVYF